MSKHLKLSKKPKEDRPVSIDNNLPFDTAASYSWP